MMVVSWDYGTNFLSSQSEKLEMHFFFMSQKVLSVLHLEVLLYRWVSNSALIMIPQVLGLMDLTF